MINGQQKGLPARADGVGLNDLAALNLSLLAGDLPLPCAVLRGSRLAHNRQWMRAFTDHYGVALCPHGKTTMSPEIFAMQLEDGAWGLTAATAHHVRVYHSLGIRRVLMANELVGQANIDLVLDLLSGDPAFELYCLVDSSAGITALADAVRRRALTQPLAVLIELGAAGGRTGVRGIDGVLQLAREVAAAAPALRLAGVEAYEGIAVAGVEGAALTRTMTEDLVGALQTLDREHLFPSGPLIVSAGGSALFDLVATALAPLRDGDRIQVILRSGCYVVHDSGTYERLFAALRLRNPVADSLGEGLLPALEVWADIQSLPESGRLIAGLGKRDVSYDIEPPQPVAWFRRGLHTAPVALPSPLAAAGLYDQHLILTGDTTPYTVGDSLIFGISHPCTTFDKWRVIPVVDDEYRVISGIHTLF
jgi:D-serine dehydratase